jgi:predicted nucleic acid-binding protein
MTARIYGELRARIRTVQTVSMSKLNDLWIAALCLQHNLPLLTNDRGFDHISGLTVIHW